MALAARKYPQKFEKKVKPENMTQKLVQTVVGKNLKS